MQGIFAALELVFWRVFMLLWPWLRWPKPSAASLRGDFCAGLTGAALVLPQGIAFARIAGLPPLFGLYSAMFAAVVAALFGSSWHLVSGPTGGRCPSFCRRCLRRMRRWRRRSMWRCRWC